MKEVVQMIDEKKATLGRGSLFRWLRDETIAGQERLSFAPSMLCYLMGFKDVLDVLHRSAIRSELDRQINAYCREDAEHWRWYLRDLEKLGYDLSSWGTSISAFCDAAWSRATQINRRTIHRLVEGAYRCEDPLLAMVLIQIFEATGVVFIAHTRLAAKAMGMDQELLYFGRIHYEEEFGHSVQGRDLLHHDLGSERRERARQLIGELFSSYDELFECWYQHRNTYVHAPVLEPLRSCA